MPDAQPDQKKPGMDRATFERLLDEARYQQDFERLLEEARHQQGQSPVVAPATPRLSDAQPDQTTLFPDPAAMERLLLPLRTLVVESVPMPARLPEEQITRVRVHSVTKDERSLDVPKAAGSFQALDRVLDAVHDVAVLAFQTWLDRLAGQASPSLEQNRALAEMVLERVDRYGLGLYYHSDGKLVRIRVRAQAPTPAQSPSPETTAAGFFVVTTSSDPSVEQVSNKRVTGRNFFPQFIVARTPERAQAIWHHRSGGSGADSRDPQV